MERGINICVINEDRTMAGITVMENRLSWRLSKLNGNEMVSKIDEPKRLKFNERYGSIIREDIFRESSDIIERRNRLLQCSVSQPYEQIKRDYIHIVCDDNYNISRSFLYKDCVYYHGESSINEYVIAITGLLFESDRIEYCAHTLLEGVSLDDMYHCHEFLIPVDYSWHISQVPNISDIIKNGLNR